MNYALQLQNVKKTYEDGDFQKTVLNNISLQVKRGEFVAIVGPSGSGKSTMLSITGALLSADSGKMVLGDTAIDEMSQKEWTKLRNDKIGFIFQNHQLLPYLTAGEQLKLIQRISRKKNVKVSVDEMLEDLGLTDCKNKYPEHMSGGEKQRTAIARAFMNDPDLILADEPTASLDGERGRQVVTMIRQEVKKRNKAAVMVTHDERILDLVDTIYRLENGNLTKI